MRFLGYLMLLAAGGVSALALLGSFADPVAEFRGGGVMSGVPREVLWVVGGLAVLGWSSVARFLISGLPAIGRWMKLRRRLPLQLAFCGLAVCWLLLG